MRGWKKKAVAAYIVMAIFTLVFQIYVRSGQCVGTGACLVSYGKAVVWSAVWPIIWPIYIAGFLMPVVPR